MRFSKCEFLDKSEFLPQCGKISLEKFWYLSIDPESAPLTKTWTKNGSEFCATGPKQDAFLGMSLQAKTFNSKAAAAASKSLCDSSRNFSFGSKNRIPVAYDPCSGNSTSWFLNWEKIPLKKSNTFWEKKKHKIQSPESHF